MHKLIGESKYKLNKLLRLPKINKETYRKILQFGWEKINIQIVCAQPNWFNIEFGDYFSSLSLSHSSHVETKFLKFFGQIRLIYSNKSDLVVY